MSFKQFLKLVFLLVSVLFMGNILVACKTMDKQISPSPVETSEQQTQLQKVHTKKQVVQKETASAPNQNLSKELLYDLLLAELASQRGDYELAFEKYYTSANITRDSRLAKKATRVSLFAKNELQTFKSVKLWSELEPEMLMCNKF